MPTTTITTTNTTTESLLARANATATRLRAAGKGDLANRFCGRAEVVITRHAARAGELLPTLYVTVERGLSPCGVPTASLDQHWLTTWTGCKVARLSVNGTALGFNGVKLTCYSAVIEGRKYYGRGLGAGMYINLRPGRIVRALN